MKASLGLVSAAGGGGQREPATGSWPTTETTVTVNRLLTGLRKWRPNELPLAPLVRPPASLLVNASRWLTRALGVRSCVCRAVKPVSRRRDELPPAKWTNDQMGALAAGQPGRSGPLASGRQPGRRTGKLPLVA